MKIACMQPYYYPYAGYFRLFAATDLFVFLDDVQFPRRGYVHRYMSNGKWTTLPIKKTPRDTTMIKDLQWQKGKEKSLSPVDYIIGSCLAVCGRLGMTTLTTRSSLIPSLDNLKCQDKIIGLCKYFKADTYINAPGGVALYDEKMFAKEGITLKFLKPWVGNHDSILERLKTEDPVKIREEILEQC